MARIQNPQNEKGEKLATEKDLLSLKTIVNSDTRDLKTVIRNKWSINSTTNSGSLTTFILPNNSDYYPTGVLFNAIQVPTLKINSKTTQAYLGVVAWYSDGTKKLLSISDNTNPTAIAGNMVWYFSTPFKIESDYRLAFYVLESKESFVLPEPNVNRDIAAIGAAINTESGFDPWNDWNRATTDLTTGFILNGPTDKSIAYPGWVACTLYELNHVNNKEIHITDEERTEWNKIETALQEVQSGDYINVTNKNIINVTNIVDTISNSSSDSLTTESSIIDYVDDTKVDDVVTKEGIITKWHKNNEYLHMEKSIGDSLKTLNVWENRQEGDICKGFIMKLPYLSKVKKISLVAANLTSSGPQSITWENYKLKIVDILNEEVLAESEPGIPGASSTATYGYPFGQFNFNVNNQIYCDADREYKILFINSSSNTEITLKLAYANGNGSYMTSTGHVFGKLSPKVILEDGTFKQAPTSFTVSDTVPCFGYSCDFAVDMVKSAEFTHLSKQIGELRTYIAYMGSYLNQLNS